MAMTNTDLAILMPVTIEAGEDKGCTGCYEQIPPGPAFEDAEGFLLCGRCAAHMATCRDTGCSHERAVFSCSHPAAEKSGCCTACGLNLAGELIGAAETSQPDPSLPHPFGLDPEQPEHAPECCYCRCGWALYARVHQVDQPKAA